MIIIIISSFNALIMSFNATYNESYDLMNNYSHINNTL